MELAGREISMRLDDQPVGTWALYQFVHPGSSGLTRDIGVFSSLREAVAVARALSQVPGRNCRGEFSATHKRSNKREGAQVDAFTETISLEPPPYSADTELTLSDGRVIWLGDVDRVLRAVLNAGVPAVLETIADPDFA